MKMHAVATVLTVYGIETYMLQRYRMYTTVATVLTVYGIETLLLSLHQCGRTQVATVLTVYGIETQQTF